jgi:hypothetical protein
MTITSSPAELGHDRHAPSASAPHANVAYLRGVCVDGQLEGQRMRALVLDGHSAAALETVQSLGRARVLVHVCSEQLDCLAFRSNYAHRKIRQPSSRFTGILGFGCGRRRSIWIRLIVPATGASLLMLRSLAETIHCV